MLNHNHRYLRLFDHQKRQLLGSDHTIYFDQRLTNAHAMDNLVRRIAREAQAYEIDQVQTPHRGVVKPRACYAAIYLNEQVLVPLTDLNNPLYK